MFDTSERSSVDGDVSDFSTPEAVEVEYNKRCLHVQKPPCSI